MSEETGFFRFDTNAGVVANDIVAAMERINATLSHPLPATQLTSVTEGFSKGMTDIEGVVAQKVPAIRKLFSDLSTGAISPQQFKSGWETMLRDTVGSVPNMMAQAIGNLNDRALAGNAPWAPMSKVVATDAVDTLNAAFKAEASRVDLKSLLGDTRLNNLLPYNLKRQIEASAGTIGFGNEIPGSLAALRNQALIESFVKQDAKGNVQALAALEEELGIRQATMALRQPVTAPYNPRGGYTYTTKTDAGEIPQFVPTRNLSAQIAEAEAAAKRYAVAGEEDVTVMNSQAQAARRAADAMSTLAAEYRQVKGGAFVSTETGRVLSGSTGAEIIGAQADRARQELRELQQREQAAQQILSRPDYRRYGSYGVVGDGPLRDVYKMNELRTEAQLLDLGGKRNEILAQEDAKQKRITEELQKQNRETARLNEAQRTARTIQADPSFRRQGSFGITGYGDARQVYEQNAARTEAQLIDLGAKRNELLAQEDRLLEQRAGEIEASYLAEKKLTEERALAQSILADPSYRRQGSYGITGYGEDRAFYQLSADRSRATQLTAAEQGKINELIAAEDTAINASVAARERELAIADKQLQTEIERARVLAANAEKQAAAGQGGASDAFLGRFTRGQDGVMKGIMAQIGSAASFTLAYGSLFALTGVMHELLHQFLDYQDSVTDLEVATRNADTVTGSWVNSLSELSRLSGANMGEAMDTAARGIRAFTDAMTSAQDVRDAGTATVDAATKLAVVANKTMPDATGDLVAAGTAFGLAPDQLNQVVDAVANAKRNVGGDAAQISQGLALIGLAAQNAGYNLNEAAAIIGLVQARTDESGQAIATRLTRVFQIVNGSTGKGLAAELGVNPDATVKDQLKDYAKIYSNPNTSEATRDRIASALGGTANLREILPLLKEGSTLQAAFKEAMNNAGQGTDEFNRKLHNLVGTLKLIKGDLSNISVGLAKSGLFDFVAGFAATLEPALYGVDKMIKGLSGFTDLVPHLQTVLGLLVDIAVVSKLVNVVSNYRAGRTAATDAGRAEVEAKQAAAIARATEARIAAEENYVAAIAAAQEGRLAAEAATADATAGSADTIVAAGEARAAAESDEIDVIASVAEARAAAEAAAIEEINAATAQRAAADAEKVAAETARNQEIAAAAAARLALEDAQNNEIAALATARIAAEQAQNEAIAAITAGRVAATQAALRGEVVSMEERAAIEQAQNEALQALVAKRIAAETAETEAIAAITAERLRAASAAAGADGAMLRERIAAAHAENEAIAAAAAERGAAEAAIAEEIAALTAARITAEEEEALVIQRAAAGRYGTEEAAAAEIAMAAQHRLAAEEAEIVAIEGVTSMRLQAASAMAGADGAGLRERIAAAQAEAEAIAASTEARLAAEGAETEAILAATEARIAAEAAAAEAVAAGGAVAGAAGAEGAAAGAAAGGLMAGTRAGAGTMLRGAMANPELLLAAIAGYAAFSYLGKRQENADLLHTQQKNVGDSLSAYTRLDGSAQSLSAAANDFRSVAGQVAKSGLPGYLKSDGQVLVDESNARAKGLTILSRQIAKEEELAAATQKYNFFGNGAIETTTQLAQGLDAIARSGGTALTAWNALAHQLNTPPPPAGERWRPKQLDGEIIGGLLGAVPKVIGRHDDLHWDGTVPQIPTLTGNQDHRAAQRYAAMVKAAGATDPNIISSHLTAALSDPGNISAMEQAIAAKTKALGLNTMQGLTAEDKAKLTAAAIQAVPDFAKLGEQGQQIVSEVVNQAIADSRGINVDNQNVLGLARQAGKLAGGGGKFANVGISDQMLNGKKISRDDLVKLMTEGPANEDGSQWHGLEAYMRAAQQAIPESDDGTQLIALLHGQVATLKGRIKAAADDGKPVAAAELLLANLMHEERQSIVNRLDALRQAAEGRANTTRELRDIRHKFALKEFRKAHGDFSILVPLFASLDRTTINYVIATLQDAYKVAQLAVQTQEDIIDQAMAILKSNPFAGTAGIYGAIEGRDKAQKHADHIKQQIKDAQKAAHDAVVSANNVTIDDVPNDLPDTKSGSAADKKKKDKADAAQAAKDHADLVAARAEAHAAYLGGGIAAARAAIIGARAQVAAAEKGTTEYFQALASLYQAQWQMKEALEQYHSNIYQLHGDMTDPVEQARDALRSAREKLSHARSKDDKAAARVDVRNSEYALEKAKWDQKLADMQTAEQLGRISSETYIRYLQRESERMHKMHDKTRQQIDHMNEIDLALKDAQGAMEGQFNLGDIDMRGFVYQTRRWAAQQHEQNQQALNASQQNASASQGTVNNNHQQIYVNGADVRKVREILREMLGDVQRRSTSPRRVR